MPDSSDTPVTAAGQVRRDAEDKAPAGGPQAVVKAAFLSQSASAFEDFLAALSSAMSGVAAEDIQREITGWLDKLALLVGAEQCVVGEFHDAEEEPRFLLRWAVGNQPEPYMPESTNWIQEQLAAGRVISIASLDEIPVEAASTRAWLEKTGLRSGIWIPLLSEGSGVGGMSLGMLSRERVWTTQTIQRCQLVANVFASALLRLKRAGDIEEREQFEALVVGIAARFTDSDKHIDALTDSVLAKLGQFLKADRVTYLEVDAKENRFMPTRNWIAPGSDASEGFPYVNLSARFEWLSAKIMQDQPVVINHLDQFPAEARDEREYCEQVGICSVAMVPATIRGVVVGALALDAYAQPRNWDDRVVSRLRVLASIIAGANDRERKRKTIAELQRFESAVATVSTTFVNLPPESVDEKIEAGLEVVARALDADLITLLQPRGQGGYVVTHEWASDELSGPGFKGVIVDETYPWLAERLSQGETIAIGALSEYPEESADARDATEREGLQSVLWVPFEIRGELAGHLAINSVLERAWSPKLFPRLRVLGEVFGEALSRRDAEFRMRESFNEISSLKEKLQQENVYLRREVRLTDRNDDIVGDSDAMQAALQEARQVAATDSTVLILGETGTGKELLARTIHNSSRRSDQVMVTVNCAALPSSLVEAELFGREKGAYTGALSREAGRFEIADGSTILLDEIGELSLELQAKLLRVLQDGEFERLGSAKTLKTDVRVLASTNRDLKKAVEDKEFREDLYYRLNVFPIELPPLRDRRDDIPKLVWTFVQEFSETMGKTIESIPAAAMESLKAYEWPGNVREVRNIVERARIVSHGPILELEPPNRDSVPGGGAVSSRKLADIECGHIRAVLDSTGWRIRGSGGAAEILGLKPTTLEARMKKLGLARSDSQ